MKRDSAQLHIEHSLTRAKEALSLSSIDEGGREVNLCLRSTQENQTSTTRQRRGDFRVGPFQWSPPLHHEARGMTYNYNTTVSDHSSFESKRKGNDLLADYDGNKHYVKCNGGCDTDAGVTSNINYPSNMPFGHTSGLPVVTLQLQRSLQAG